MKFTIKATLSGL